MSRFYTQAVCKVGLYDPCIVLPLKFAVVGAISIRSSMYALHASRTSLICVRLHFFRKPCIIHHSLHQSLRFEHSVCRSQVTRRGLPLSVSGQLNLYKEIGPILKSIFDHIDQFRTLQIFEQHVDVVLLCSFNSLPTNSGPVWFNENPSATSFAPLSSSARCKLPVREGMAQWNQTHVICEHDTYTLHFTHLNCFR